MIEKSGISRRLFITSASVAAGCTLLTRKPRAANGAERPTVIRINNPEATSWDYTVDPKKTDRRYWNFIDQEAVGSMVDRGVCELTGTDNPAEAWRTIMRSYSRDDRVAVKINLNNVEWEQGLTTNRMDASLPVIESVVSGLVDHAGVPEEMISIYDASRPIQSAVLIDRCRFRGINWISCTTPDRWDADAEITFRDAPGPGGDFHLPKVVTQSQHLLNLSLFKAHDCGVTGALKNHYGSIPSPGNLHGAPRDSGSYIGDINNNPHIRNKTRLFVCDGLFGNWHNNVWEPRAWKTFSGDSPNSVFFAFDPVAMDSVLVDHIIKECEAQGDKSALERALNHAHLNVAMTHHGLGVYERSPFSAIDYRTYDA